MYEKLSLEFTDGLDTVYLGRVFTIEHRYIL